eukprot:EG_transcript_15819
MTTSLQSLSLWDSLGSDALTNSAELLPLPDCHVLPPGNSDGSPEGFCRQVYQLPTRADYDTLRTAFDAVVPLLHASLPDRSLRVMALGFPVTTLFKRHRDVLQLSLLQDPPMKAGNEVRKAARSVMLIPGLKEYAVGTHPYWIMLQTMPNVPLRCAIGFGSDVILESYWIRRFLWQCTFARPLAQLVAQWQAAWTAADLAPGRSEDRLTHALHLMVLFFLMHEGLAPYQPPVQVDFATLPSFPDFLPFEQQPVPWPYVVQLLPQFFRFYAQWPAGRAVVFSEPPTAVVTCQAKGWRATEFGVELPHRPAVNATLFLTTQRWAALRTAFAAAADMKDPLLLFRPPPPE